jgi:hypothetical protein
MNSKGKEVKPPLESRTQTSLGLAIAYAHKQLSTVNNPKTSALIRELNPDNTSKIVKLQDNWDVRGLTVKTDADQPLDTVSV